MIEGLRRVLEGALERLQTQISTYVPSLLAAISLVMGAYVVAWVARWTIYRIFKGLAIDKFLRQSGVAFVVDPTGRLRATRIVAEGVYWAVLVVGVLLGVNVFGTDLTTRMVQDLVFLLPKLLIAGVILLGGAWLGHYLGRSALVWAMNENLPGPRRLAAGVRVMIQFTSVVVAAEQLEFARVVFLSAFVLVVGGVVATAGVLVVRGRLGEKEGEGAGERSLWSHL